MHLTSRERVREALEHRQPDRVPMGFELSNAAYKNLRQYLGFPPASLIQNCDCGNIRLDTEIAGFLGLDLICLQMRSPGDCSGFGQSVSFDAWHIGRRITENKPGIFSVEIVESPLADALFNDLHRFAWPNPDDPAWTSGLEETARQIYTQTELALVGRFGGPVLDTAAALRGPDQWLDDLTNNPDFACALLNRIAGVQIALDAAGLRAAGKYLSLLKIADAGLPATNPLIQTTQAWQHTIRPVLERRWRSVKDYIRHYAPQAKLMYESPALHANLMQEWISSGIDVTGPLPPCAKKTDLSALKRDFGSQICFYGGVDARGVLACGSEETVRQSVKDCLRHMGPSGGYLLTPTQPLEVDVPPQNIVAMCETVKVYGRYPSR